MYTTIEVGHKARPYRHSSDIHEIFACIAIYRLICIAPLAKPRISRLEQQGELDERELGLKGL